jgi:hypothetical protein
VKLTRTNRPFGLILLLSIFGWSLDIFTTLRTLHRFF